MESNGPLSSLGPWTRWELSRKRNWRQKLKRGIERNRGAWSTALRPRWQRTKHKRAGIEWGEDHSPCVQMGHKQHSMGAHRPTAEGHSGFIPWRWIQVLMGTVSRGHCPGQCGQMQEGPQWLSTCESTKGIPEIAGRGLGQRDGRGWGPHRVSQCSEPVNTAYDSALPYLYPHVGSDFPDLTFGAFPTFMKRMLVRQFFPGQGYSEKKQAGWRESSVQSWKSEVNYVNVLFHVSSLYPL